MDCISSCAYDDIPIMKHIYIYIILKTQVCVRWHTASSYLPIKMAFYSRRLHYSSTVPLEPPVLLTFLSIGNYYLTHGSAISWGQFNSMNITHTKIQYWQNAIRTIELLLLQRSMKFQETFYDFLGLRFFAWLPFVNTHDQCPLVFNLMPFGWLHFLH